MDPASQMMQDNKVQEGVRMGLLELLAESGYKSLTKAVINLDLENDASLKNTLTAFEIYSALRELLNSYVLGSRGSGFFFKNLDRAKTGEYDSFFLQQVIGKGLSMHLLGFLKYQSQKTHRIVFVQNNQITYDNLIGVIENKNEPYNKLFDLIETLSDKQGFNKVIRAIEYIRKNYQ